MDKNTQTPLRAFVEAYATQNTEGADALLHEYITKKAQTIINGEEAPAEETTPAGE